MRSRGPGFGDVLRVAEFRAIWLAELGSVLGDQLARVALALLVFYETSSAALSALTYALTFVPAILGGALLSGLADRFPRRGVLICTDLLRAGLAAAMAVPGLPLPVLWVLVGLLSMAAGPFKAAYLALLPQILAGERYVVGLALRQMTVQGAQLVGFASGGLLLSAVEPHVALAANAGTFLFSALLITRRVRRRPAAADPLRTASSANDATGTGSRQVLAVAALVAIAGLFVVPEGIAAPYGTVIGAGALGVGLLMAADPLGSVIGAWLLARTRIRPSRRSAVALAAGSGVPLLLCAAGPGLALTVALWAVSGAFSTACLIQTQQIVAELVPDQRRGRVMGQIATVLYASQGLAIVVAGFAAQATGPFRAVAGAGLLGTVLALCVGVWWRRVARSRRDLVTGSERASAAPADSQYSLLRIKDTSLRSNGASSRTTSGQYSLLAMKGTSSRATGGDNGIRSGQYSLLAMKGTSSCTSGINKTGPAQYSLFRMRDTSSRTSGGINRTWPGQYSLFRMSGTSFRTGLPTYLIGDRQYSLLRMEDTSFSPLNRIADHVMRSVAKLMLPLNRRLGTRAPSLWGWPLAAAVRLSTTERTTAR